MLEWDWPSREVWHCDKHDTPLTIRTYVFGQTFLVEFGICTPRSNCTELQNRHIVLRGYRPSRRFFRLASAPDVAVQLGLVVLPLDGEPDSTLQLDLDALRFEQEANALLLMVGGSPPTSSCSKGANLCMLLETSIPFFGHRAIVAQHTM